MSTWPKFTGLAAGVIVGLALAGCKGPEEPTPSTSASPADTAPVRPSYNTQIDVADLMVHVLDPSARAFWRGWGEEMTSTGWKDISPTTDEEWQRVEDGAATLVIASNVLLLPDYARQPVADWDAFASEVARIAIAGKESAHRRDSDAIMKVGETLNQACDACHHRFAQNATPYGG